MVIVGIALFVGCPTKISLFFWDNEYNQMLVFLQDFKDKCYTNIYIVIQFQSYDKK